MTEPIHPDLELQDLVDGRVDTAERERLQAHLDMCDHCRAELELLRRARHFARQLPRLDPPTELVRGIASDLARAKGAERQRTRRWERRRWLVYGVAAAAVLFIVAYVGKREDVPASAIRGAATSTGAESRLEFATSDPPSLERFFASRLPFRTRVFDLAMMNYRLVGGRVGQVASHQAAIYTYAGPDGRWFTCEMYVGTLAELPHPDARRDRNGISFLIFKRGPTTAVFWIEGHLVCVALSEMPTDEVVALAFAKALKS
jgi:anti-sigma factor RsiW